MRQAVKRFWEAWNRIAHAIGNFQARILLTVIYAGLTLPFGLAARFSLRLSENQEESSDISGEENRAILANFSKLGQQLNLLISSPEVSACSVLFWTQLHGLRLCRNQFLALRLLALSSRCLPLLFLFCAEHV